MLIFLTSIPCLISFQAMKFTVCCLLAFFLLSTTSASALKYIKAEETTVTGKSFSKPAPLTLERSVPRKWRAKNLETNSNKVTQSWLKNGTKCSKDTIPVRRSTADNVMTNNAMFEHGKKHHSSYHQLPADNISPEHAILVYNREGSVYQAKAMINVWNPSVEGANEYSAARIRLAAGKDEDLNVIEAGWHVYPSRYHNSPTTRFFIFTRVASHQSGCYNFDCKDLEGFDQFNDATAIGGTLQNTSSYDGDQHYITVDISRDKEEGNWWLSVDEIAIGLWPNNIFTSMAKGATHVSWGGTVLNLRRENRHTSTKMGSGHFSNEGERKASSFINLQIKSNEDGVLNPVSRQDIVLKMTNSDCYNITDHAHTRGALGCSIFYGGPGHDSTNSCS